jgi:hypothetical protein
LGYLLYDWQHQWDLVKLQLKVSDKVEHGSVVVRRWLSTCRKIPRAKLIHHADDGAASTYKMSVNCHQTTQHNHTDDSHFHIQHLKSHLTDLYVEATLWYVCRFKPQNQFLHTAYSLPCWQKQQVPQKQSWTSTRLHSATIQKTAVFIHIMQISNMGHYSRITVISKQIWTVVCLKGGCPRLVLPSKCCSVRHIITHDFILYLKL